jgi:hypothetical protein
MSEPIIIEPLTLVTLLFYAIDRDERFGRWAYEIVYYSIEVLKVLDRYAAKRAA